MKEVIYVKQENANLDDKLSCQHELMTLEEAIGDKEYEAVDVRKTNTKVHDEEKKLPDEFCKGNPNLTLNIDGAVASGAESKLFALLGLVLQLAVILMWALTVYHWKLTRARKITPSYGCPCAISGAVIVLAGLLLCAHVVEDVTTERSYKPKVVSKSDPPNQSYQSNQSGPGYEVMRIQKASTVGSQRFGSFMIHNCSGDSCLRMSRRRHTNERMPRRKAYTNLGTFLSVAGFFVQFIGLRTLHFSATLMQLGLMVAMTGLRAWLRRGLTRKPDRQELREGYELSDAVLKLNKIKSFGLLTLSGDTLLLEDVSSSQKRGDSNIRPKTTSRSVTMGTGAGLPNVDSENLANQEYRVVRMRAKLEQVTAWSEDCSPWGKIVANAIEKVFLEVYKMRDGEGIIKFKEDFTRKWTVKTYMQKLAGVTKTGSLVVGPKKFAKMGDKEFISQSAEIYTAIMSLWYADIVQNVDQGSLTTKEPFARVIGRERKGVGDNSCISKWIRATSWRVGAAWPSSEPSEDKESKRFNSKIQFGKQFSSATPPKYLALTIISRLVF